MILVVAEAGADRALRPGRDKPDLPRLRITQMDIPLGGGGVGVGSRLRDEEMPVRVLVPILKLLIKRVGPVEAVERDRGECEQSDLDGVAGAMFLAAVEAANHAIGGNRAGIEERNGVVEERYHRTVPPHGKVRRDLAALEGRLLRVDAFLGGARELAETSTRAEGIGDLLHRPHDLMRRI